MDLIYTNAAREDQGVLFDYEFDLAFGGDENTFECTILAEKHCCEPGSFLYIEGTEYGGIVDSIKVDTEKQTITYLGRTWHGILEGAVIQPESGYDYHFVTGEGNAVLAGLIEYLGLSDIFKASNEDSGIHVASYAFRYVDAYSGICKMLAEYDGKLKMKHDVDKVILYTEPLVDYSQDDEFDSSQVDFTVQKNHRPVNHLICLGHGDLKDRYVIHLFTDENGGVQPYKTRGNPVEDADYILDQSKQLLTGVDEVAEVLNYPNAQTVENLVKLKDQPSDWSKNYASYFKMDAYGNYVNVEGIPSENITVLTAEPEDWNENYASYFQYVDGELRSVEAVTTEHYSEMTKKPVDWETNYGNYFVYWSDGVDEGYNPVMGVSAVRYVPQTIRPSDWKTNYSSYYARYSTGNGTKMMPVQGVEGSRPETVHLLFAPTWEPKRFYTAESYEVAPEWTHKSEYYRQYKITRLPAFVPGIYYTKQDVLLTPSFLPDVMFKKVFDHYAELVASGLERLMQSYNCDSVDIDLDMEGNYDIGDIVGASEHTTGITVWQPITKKIVTIKNGVVTVSMKMDVKNVSTYMSAGASSGSSGGFGAVPGSDGEDGKDGVSCTHVWNGTVLTITSASGTSSADLKGEPGADGSPGKDGRDGKDGVDGSPGKDGYTPQKGIDYFDGEDGQNGVSCTHSWNGTTLTVTSASGTSSANLKGDKGDPGSGGAAGADATINGVNALTIKAGTNISLEQSGSTLTINASGGSTATAMTVDQIKAICT